MRVSSFITTLALTIAWSGIARGELRTISRNSLMFVDSVREGGEWAAYRLADETRPVIFRAEGPARVVLKLRTIIPKDGKDAKEAVGAILNDDRVVLTARIEPARDAEAKLVEGAGRSLSKSRVYVVRLGAGEHTVTVRFSEGAPLLVGATLIEGVDPAEVSDRSASDEDVPVAPLRRQEADRTVQRIGKVAIGEVTEITEEGSSEAPEGGSEEAAEPSHGGGKREDDEAWNNVPSKRKLRIAGGTPVGPEDEKTQPLPADPFRRPPVAGISSDRKLTVRAPYFMAEAHAGVMVSRLGLDPGFVLGGEARLPVPGLDARAWTVGLSLDANYARGQSRIVGEASGAPIGIAKVRHFSVELGADLRWTFLPIENVLDPYVAAGLGALIGSMSSDDGTAERSAGTFGLLGVVSAGAAFGPAGARPYFELRFSGGRIFSDLAKSGPASDTDSGAGYAELDAVLGYRFELLTDVAAD